MDVRVGLWRKLSTEELMFWTVVLEKTLESPLNCKEIQPVHPKGNQSWIFIGRTNAKAEAPILWSPNAKNWLIGKTLMLGKIEDRWRRGWHRVKWLHGITDSGREFEQAWRAGDGQRSLACCSPWICEESDMTERLNWHLKFQKTKFYINIPNIHHSMYA